MKNALGTSCAAVLCLMCLSCNASAKTVGAQLKGADANKDGLITREEILAYRAKRFPSLDRNEDGLLTSNDIPAFVTLTSRGVELENLIRDFDANADGGVSEQEFVNGPTVLFDRTDVNNDGALSADELKADVNTVLD
jgi:Ca2+-binding EF-hand superfamily protein